MNITERSGKLLESAREKCAGLAGQFSGSFGPLLSSVASLYAMAYSAFEREVSNEAEPLKKAVEDGIENFPQQAEQKYKAAEAAARVQLLTNLKGAFRAELLDEDDRADLALKLKQQLPSRVDAVCKQKVAMAGRDNARIKVPAHDLVGRIVGFVIGIVVAFGVGEWESLFGYSIWEGSFNAQIALGLTLATVLIPTVLTHFVITHYRRYMAWKEATLAFDKAGGRQEKGFEVDPFPRAEYIMAVWGMRLLVAVILTLVVYRGYLVIHDNQEVAGLVGAAVIALIVLVYALISFVLALPYDGHQYEALREAQSELDQINSRIKQATDVPEQSMFRQGADKAREEYETAINEAREQTKKDRKALDAKRTELLTLLHECEGVWDLFLHSFRETCNDVITKVTRRHSLDGTSHPFGEQDEDRRIMGLFTGLVQRKYHDPELVAKLQGHKFTVKFDDPALSEFATIEGEARAALAVRKIGVIGADQTAASKEVK